MVVRCLNLYLYDEANHILDYLKPTSLYHTPERDRFVRLCILSRYYREPRTLDADVVAELREAWAKTLVEQQKHNLVYYETRSDTDTVVSV